MAIKLNQAMLMELGFARSDIAALQALISRSGISDAAVTALDNQKQFEEFSVTNPEAIEAQHGVDELRNALPMGQDPLMRENARAIDELRNEVAATRSDFQMLRAMIDDLQSAAATFQQTDTLRNRIESIEDRLA